MSEEGSKSAKVSCLRKVQNQPRFPTSEEGSKSAKVSYV
jgi:hypothetical protein